MKRPTKTPLIVRKPSTKIELFDQYPPNELIQIAEEMKAEGILDIEIEPGWDSCEIFERRLETELEAEVRYKKEMKKYKTFKKREEINKEKKKERLIRDAKKLGLKVVE